MKKHFLFLLLLLFSLNSCVNNNGGSSSKSNDRTVLIYMVADNNLYNDAVNNINQLEMGWDDNYPGTVLVFFNQRGEEEPTVMLKIEKDATSKIVSKIVKNYGKKVDACDPAVLSKAISDAKAISSSKTMGLILWSHGSGWLPKPNSKSGTTYAFGDNSLGSQMNIYDLADALPADEVFDFIAFDACYMGCVEVAYQLKDNAKYLVSFAAEIPSQGFPYDLVIGEMMKSPNADVVGLARKTFDYYNALSGWERTCLVSVVDNEKLPAVASAFKEMITNNSSEVLFNSETQDFGYESYKGIFYDIKDFADKSWKDAAGLDKFNTALDNAIIYKANTPKILGTETVNTFCGLSAYVPRKYDSYNLSIYKNKFDWSKDSGLDQIVF